MTTELRVFIDRLKGDFLPIVEQAKKYYDKDSKIREDGTAEMFRRPWVAPHNYGLWLFPPADRTWLNKFKQRNGMRIPKLYQSLLLELNGCFVYGFSLYGLPKSIYTKGLLDRSTTQQFDLGTANVYWMNEYKNTGHNLFQIGGRSYSPSENIGYFIKKDKLFSKSTEIFSIRKSGEILKIWNTLAEFLRDEISVAEERMLETLPADIKENWK